MSEREQLDQVMLDYSKARLLAYGAGGPMPWFAVSAAVSLKGGYDKIETLLAAKEANTAFAEEFAKHKSSDDQSASLGLMAARATEVSLSTTLRRAFRMRYLASGTSRKRAGRDQDRYAAYNHASAERLRRQQKTWLDNSTGAKT